MSQTSKSYEVVVKPRTSSSVWNELVELAKNWEVAYALALRSIQVRYKQTVVGVVWAILQPVVTTVIFTFVFSVLARIPSSGDIPYPVFVFSGLLMWQYINRIIGEASDSLVANAGIITKVYFPRLLLPLTPIIAAALDFFLALCVLIVLMLIYGLTPRLTILALPIVLFSAGLLVYSISLILAPLNAIYRDVNIVLPYALQISMYLTPVIYPVSFVPERFQWIFIFNPFATILDSTRSLVLGTPLPSVEAYAILAGYIAIFLFIGLKTFRSMERSIVDRI